MGMLSRWMPCTIALLLATGCSSADKHAAKAQLPAHDVVITQTGAIADGTTINTKAIQAAIDQCSTLGGGTVIVPKGEFLTGALFVKPGVNVTLQEGGVLRGSKSFADFPLLQNERFEGHFEPRVAALINVPKHDHFRLTGPGTLDGNGEAYWKTNSPDGRPRLVAIRDSDDVLVSGVHFWNSATWNLHLYNCTNSNVENCRFEISDKGKGPSTDGTDVDSCTHIHIKGCFYSVNDDCICLKGNRYDGLDQEPKSPPVTDIHVTDCTFVRGMGALSLGTEATVIRGAEIGHCVVKGAMPMFRVKYRPDTTGQDYSDVHVHDITLDGRGLVLSVEPTHGTKVPADKTAHAVLHDVTVENITGTFGAIGKITGGANVEVSNFTIRHVKVTTPKDPILKADGVKNLMIDDVIVNDAPVKLSDGSSK